ncbi:MAG: DUF1893 domain-containing protein [Peptococcaceae bacterium]|nr:DUF1893 domain-containing protein [Peptococcaceae bacterium]
MNIALIKAKEQLQAEDNTCVLYKEGRLYTSKARGVKPLLGVLAAEEDWQGASAADKVVGKAAAFLYVLLGVAEVYAGVVSEVALEVFQTYHIAVTYDVLVPAIRNRTDTGFCPMEEAVWHCQEPKEAVGLIQAKLVALQKEEKQK